MAIFGALNWLLGMETSGWTKGSQKAQRDVDALQKKTEGFMHSLRAFKRTGLGESLEIAAGGGALRVIDEVARKFGDLAGKISEIRKQMQEGKADGADMFEGVMGSLPFIGEVWKAGREIREAFTGEKAAVEAANESLKAQAAVIAIIKKVRADELEYEKSVTKEIEKQRYLQSLIGMSPEDRKQAEAAHAADASIGSADDKFDAAKNAAEKSLGEGGISAQDAVYQNAKANLDALQAKRQAVHQAWEEMQSNEYSAQVRGATAMKQLQTEGIPTDEALVKAAQVMSAAKAKIDTYNKAVEDATAAHAQEVAATQRTASEQAVQEQNDADSALFQSVQDGIDKRHEQKQNEHAEEMKALQEANQRKLDEEKRLVDRLTEEAQTPMQKFLAEMKQIDVLEQAGKIDASVHDTLQSKYESDLASTNRAAERAIHTTAPTTFHNGGVGLNTNAKQVKNPVTDLVTIARQQLEDARRGLKLAPESIAAITGGAMAIPL